MDTLRPTTAWPELAFGTSERPGLKASPSISGSCRVPGCWLGSSDERSDEGAEQGFAASARIVHELEEAEIKRQLVFRDAPLGTQPGAQEGPKTLDRVDV